MTFLVFFQKLFKSLDVLFPMRLESHIELSIVFNNLPDYGKTFTARYKIYLTEAFR